MEPIYIKIELVAMQILLPVLTLGQLKIFIKYIQLKLFKCLALLKS